jgi:hypothetical protein
MIALRALGHSVELVCPDDATLGIRAQAAGFTVHNARMRGGADVRSMLTIRSILDQRRFDVLNTHSGHGRTSCGNAINCPDAPSGVAHYVPGYI